jgi:hypothetical protein
MAQLIKDGKVIRLIFEPELTVAGVKQLFSHLLKVPKKKPQLVIFNMVELVKVDTAVLQALIVMVNIMKKNSIPLKWEGCSVNFINSAKLLGLDEALGLGS